MFNHDYGLFLIDSLLPEQHRSLHDYPVLPNFVIPWQRIAGNPLLSNERNHNPDYLRDESARLLENFNEGQRNFYEQISNLLQIAAISSFLFQGPAVLERLIHTKLCVPLYDTRGKLFYALRRLE